jgi:hypothetical protein
MTKAIAGILQPALPLLFIIVFLLVETLFQLARGWENQTINVFFFMSLIFDKKFSSAADSTVTIQPNSSAH